MSRGYFNDLSYGIKQSCIKANEIWEVQLYPETPIGFEYLVTHDFGEVIEFIFEGQ